MKTRTILIVDNHQKNRKQLSAQLQQLGFRVVESHSTQASLKITNQRQIDIALLPFQLLKKEGLTNYYKLKSQFPHLYSILTFAKNDLQHAIDILNKGLDTYQFSPLSTEELELTLLQAISVLELREENQTLRYKSQKTNLFYESLLNSASEAVVVINQNFDITYCNLPFQKYLNSNLASLTGQNLQKYVNDGFKVLNYIFQQLTLNKKVRGYQISLKPENNKMLDVITSAEFLYSSEGYVEGIILNMEDKTLQDDVFNQLMRKERLNTIKILASALAHEIQNPTNILSGRVQLLNEELKDQNYEKSLEIINRQLQRISDIISQMQKFNHNREDTIPQVFPLIEFLETHLKQNYPSKKLKVKLYYEQKEKDILVQANPFQFEDAFTYLFTTLDSILPSKKTLHVHCHLLKSFSQNPCLEVQIDVHRLAMREEILEPFQNLTPHEKYSILNLALLHTIFANYGGKIFVDNSPKDQKILKLQFPVAGVKNLNPTPSKQHSASNGLNKK